jgi:hypothetical protein
MALRGEDWSAVGKAVESLAKNLKLYAEDITGEGGQTLKDAADSLADGVERSFDVLRATTDDPAPKADVRDVARLLRSALVNTITQLYDEIASSNRPGVR